MNKSVVVKFSQSGYDHHEDLVKVTRLSVVHQIVSECHLITRHRECNMIKTDVCTSERTEMLCFLLLCQLHDWVFVADPQEETLIELHVFVEVELVCIALVKNNWIYSISGWFELALERSFISHELDNWIVELHIQHNLSCIAIKKRESISFLIFIALEERLDVWFVKSNLSVVVQDWFDRYTVLFQIFFWVSCSIVNL